MEHKQVIVLRKDLNMRLRVVIAVLMSLARYY
jgi:hypothetical protein